MTISFHRARLAVLSGLRLTDEVAIALGVAVIGMAGIAYEIAGLTRPGRHTISYAAHRSRVLRLAILAAFMFGGAWWWWHSGQDIAR